DQDKTRPLSTLANLAIIITDVQDTDPIFINLPYSTNIYEHSPPDTDPIFINLPYSTNIYEHSPPGTTVHIITAIDQDKGRPRGIGYTIVSGKVKAASVFSSSTREEPLSGSQALRCQGEVCEHVGQCMTPASRGNPHQRTWKRDDWMKEE
ncbi:PREDICTED: protocadherin-8-like, partial [Galeopterus variegatus]|uniref:Protocadherin-8-like n=1 Tax=Galeopterus variegatus TaxID=482537 RepID=A0ABM0Q2I7_GALVR